MKKSGRKIDYGAVFLTSIFIIGLLTVFPYGAHLDQTSEQAILYSNVKEYAGLFGASNPLYRELDSAGVIDITQSIEKDHGMAVYYPMAWIFFVNRISPFAGNILWHGYIYVLSFCGTAALFYLLSGIFGGRVVPMFTTLLYFVTPRMFAESHYNNKDMILLSLALCTAFFGWKVHRTKSWGNVAAFSLVGSLAANMKIIGAFIWGIAGIYILLALLVRHQLDKGMVRKAAACIAMWLGFYLLITPACRMGLLEFWKYLLDSARDFRWNDYILFAGRMYSKQVTGMPKAYLPVMILLTVPVGILLLAVTGAFSLPSALVRFRGRNADGAWYLLAMTLSCLIPLGYAVLSGTPVYNGWRHFYFVYMAVLLLAAQGISWLSGKFRSRKGRRWLASLLGVYVFLLAAGIAASYPHEYAYYNILAGKNVGERYELDYWDMSFKQAYERILQNPDGEPAPGGRVKIGAISTPAYWGLEAQRNAIRGKLNMLIDLCDDYRDAEYVIVNPTYALMYGASDYEYVKKNYILKDTITSYGNVICEIYQTETREQRP